MTPLLLGELIMLSYQESIAKHGKDEGLMRTLKTDWTFFEESLNCFLILGSKPFSLSFLGQA